MRTWEMLVSRIGSVHPRVHQVPLDSQLDPQLLACVSDQPPGACRLQRCACWALGCACCAKTRHHAAPLLLLLLLLATPATPLHGQRTHWYMT